MYRAVKRPADAAAGTQRLARPDFLSLGAVLSLGSIVHSERPPAESGGLRSTRRDGRIERGTRARASRRAFISPINFVDSGWRKNWVKSRGCISSIFPSDSYYHLARPLRVHRSLFIPGTACMNLYEARSFPRDTRACSGPIALTAISPDKLGAARNRSQPGR